jgi:hypothetical protein
MDEVPVPACFFVENVSNEVSFEKLPKLATLEFALKQIHYLYNEKNWLKI